MPLGLGPRFVVEAAFLIAVAVAAGMLSLATPAIVAVMAGAWLLVAAVEWGLSRRAAARSGAREEAVATSDRSLVTRVEHPPEPLLEPEPFPEPLPPEPVEEIREARPSELVPDGAPPPPPEPLPPAVEEPEPVGARPELVAVPEPEPEPEPVREPEPDRAEVVRLGAPQEPREWNLWDLERAARAASGDDAERDEERAFLLMYLREFAGPDGSLPTTFDGLVRDTFGDLHGSGAR
jgi:outer membrane biosynthesis protein TonB